MSDDTFDRSKAKPEDFNERRFWKTVRRYASKWGDALLRQVVTLYYVMRDPKTPARSKAVIGGALAYLVLPADLIPDLLPMVGWTDDAAAIAWAALEVVNSIKDEHRAKAAETISRLLGKGKEQTAPPDAGAANSHA